MMTAKRWTTKSLLSAAKRKYGDKVSLRESNSAPTAAQREALKAELAKCIEERKQAEATIAACGLREAFDSLAKAAQFVIDVNGDSPSIADLSNALVDAMKTADALDEKHAAIKRVDELNVKMFHYRFRLSSTQGIFTHVIAEGDTLDAIARRAAL